MRCLGKVLVKISARQTADESYGIFVELKAEPVTANPKSKTIVKTADLADVICFCKVIHPLDLLDRRPNTLFNRWIADPSEISGEAVTKLEFQVLILDLLKF